MALLCSVGNKKAVLTPEAPPLGKTAIAIYDAAA